MLCKHSAAISFCSNPLRASIEPQDLQNDQQGNGLFKMIGSGLFFLFSLFFALPAWAVDLTLAWDPNSEPNLEGYGVYYKKGSAGPPYNLYGYVKVDEFSDPNTPTFTIADLEKGFQYYFALTAYDTAGTESSFSNAVCAEIGDVIAPCIAETPADAGSSSGGSSSSSGGGGSNNGCFIDTLSADRGGFDPGMAAPFAFVCLTAFIRIAQRYIRRFCCG